MGHSAHAHVLRANALHSALNDVAEFMRTTASHTHEAANPDPAVASINIPLCVDLDGTLIHGDTLLISLSQILRQMPWRLPRLAWALLRGRAHFKKCVADCLIPQPCDLPYRQNVLEFLKGHRAKGRRLILATAAERRIAQAVAAYLGIFEEVLACDGRTNLKGVNKLRAINALLKDGPFEYIGDSRSDLPILSAAQGAYLVSPSPSLVRAAQKTCRLLTVL
jgi:hypothetical protein